MSLMNIILIACGVLNFFFAASSAFTWSQRLINLSVGVFAFLVVAFRMSVGL